MGSESHLVGTSLITMDQNWENTSWSKDNSANRGGAGPKKAQNSSETKKFRSLEDADEAGSHEKVSQELKMLIQKGRIAKKLSQAAVAKAINEKSQTINEYESGKAQPNQQVLIKLERALGVKLRGLGKTKKKK